MYQWLESNFLVQKLLRNWAVRIVKKQLTQWTWKIKTMWKNQGENMCKWESTEQLSKEGRDYIPPNMIDLILDVNIIDCFYGTSWCRGYLMYLDLTSRFRFQTTNEYCYASEMILWISCVMSILNTNLMFNIRRKRKLYMWMFLQ